MFLNKCIALVSTLLEAQHQTEEGRRGRHRYRDYEKLFIMRWEKFSEGEPRSVLCNVAMGLQYIHRKQLGHLNATSKNKTVDG